MADRGTWTWALLAVATLLAPSPTRSNPSPASDPEHRFARGTQEWGLALGNGFGFALGRSGDSDVEDVQFAALVPRFGLGLTDRLGADAWYHGNLELLVEGALLQAYEPKGGFAGGATLGLRWNFLAWRGIVPFVELAAGLVDLEFDLDHQSDGINFTPQAGLGFHYWLSERTAFTSQWRFHHISNADLRDPNDGINDSLFLLGISLFPE